MASLYDVVAGLTEMRAEIQKMGADAEVTTGKVREMNEAQSTNAGKSTQRTGGGSLSIGSTYLGDPRDASSQTAAMLAAIEAAKRR